MAKYKVRVRYESPKTAEFVVDLPASKGAVGLIDELRFLYYKRGLAAVPATASNPRVTAFARLNGEGDAAPRTLAHPLGLRRGDGDDARSRAWRAMSAVFDALFLDDDGRVDPDQADVVRERGELFVDAVRGIIDRECLFDELARVAGGVGVAADELA